VINQVVLILFRKTVSAGGEVRVRVCAEDDDDVFFVQI